MVTPKTTECSHATCDTLPQRRLSSFLHLVQLSASGEAKVVLILVFWMQSKEWGSIMALMEQSCRETPSAKGQHGCRCLYTSLPDAQWQSNPILVGWQKGLNGPWKNWPLPDCPWCNCGQEATELGPGRPKTLPGQDKGKAAHSQRWNKNYWIFLKWCLCAQQEEEANRQTELSHRPSGRGFKGERAKLTELADSCVKCRYRELEMFYMWAIATVDFQHCLICLPPRLPL